MKRLLVAAGLALAATVAAVAPASAQQSLTIRRIDTTDFPEVRVLVQAPGSPRLNEFNLRDGGRLVPDLRVLPLDQTSVPVGVVLTIDISGSMRDNDNISHAKAAARQFIANKLPNDEIAVVAFSDQPRVVANFTADRDLLNDAVSGLQATGATALWDAVRLGTGLFADRPDLQPNMVVLSDGADTVSSTSAAEARSLARAGSLAVYTVGLRGGGEFAAAPLRQIAGDTGAEYLETRDARALGELYQRVQTSIQGQYELVYQSSAEGAVNVQVSLGDLSATAAAPVGATSQAATNDPEPVSSSPLPGFLSGAAGKWLLVGLVLVAAAMLFYGFLLLVTRDRSELESALLPYGEEATAAREGARPEVTFAESPLMRRGVEATARLVGERGILEALERRLEQADLPMRPAEALFFYGAGVVIVSLAALVLGGPFTLLVVGVIAALLPLAVLSFMASRRQRAFSSQLPDTLQLLAGSLRAGFSLLQGVDAVAQEVSDPMGSELRRVLAEARLGRDLEEALEDAGVRMGSADFDWAVMAVRIQREVGGNLAELLDTVGETMRSRERLRREVRALTAEGRISAIILGIMPVALGVLMYSINPDYMRQLIEETAGRIMLVGAFLLALVGFYWMKKVIEIDI